MNAFSQRKLFDIIQIILAQNCPPKKIIFMSEMKMCTMLKNREKSIILQRQCAKITQNVAFEFFNFDISKLKMYT